MAGYLSSWLVANNIFATGCVVDARDGALRTSIGKIRPVSKSGSAARLGFVKPTGID
jgi:hypothetical protein